jgi:hypothetical protein
MDKEEILRTIYEAKLKIITIVTTTALTALGIGFVGITIFSVVTLKSEREFLKDLENQIKSKADEQVSLVKGLEGQISNKLEENTRSIKTLEQGVQEKADYQTQRIDMAILKMQKAPKVVALVRSGVPLHENIVKGRIIKRGGQEILLFNIIFKNEGTSPSDPLFVKWYTREPLKPKDSSPSSDEPGYDFENVSDPENPKSFPNTSKVLPAQVSYSFKVESAIERIDHNTKTHKIVLKIYYGADNPYRATFSLEIEDKENNS